jgi:hypothetical protein
MRTPTHPCLAFLGAMMLLLAALPATAQNDDGLSGSQQRRLSSLSTRITSIEDRLRALSKRSERLSEKIFKKNFSFGAPRLRIVYEDRIGCTFRVNTIQITLNGKQIFAHNIKTQPAIKGRQIVFDQEVPVGRHRVIASFVVEGYGCGVFTYMKKYKNIRAQKLAVIVTEKGQASLVAIGPIDKGGDTVENRVDISVDFSKSPIANPKP